MEPDISDFICANLPLTPVPSAPEIILHTATPASGLMRLGDAAPYWAYPWAGGQALARHLMDLPLVVGWRRVLDLGCGGGIVAIAAAKSGAASVLAADVDANALAALRLNAAANGVVIATTGEDLLSGPPPVVDLILVGDLFYEAALAERVMAFLDRCLAARIEVLIGDIGRAHLPRERLRLLADYPVTDFGDAAVKSAGVYRLEPHPAAARPPSP